MLQKAVDEMDPELLAVRDDVDAGVLLGLEPEQGRVLFGGREVGPFGAPLRPELLGLGQPGGLPTTVVGNKGSFMILLSAIAALAAVTQPQPHEMAFLFWPFAIDEIGAGVAGAAVVDDLDLAGLED